MQAWITAFRLRTLPLALSSIGMGSFLAAADGGFRIQVFLLCALTTILLQVLSNLANDYGDSVHGADHSDRTGPSRMVQSGVISASQMRLAMIVFAVMALISGILLLYISFGWDIRAFLFFLALGIMAIIAAIAYTAGRRPYGYMGLGDVSVMIFFGIVGVIGSYYLFVQTIPTWYLLPAYACGAFAVGVLNLNNIRDIESDRKAGKFSIPVRIGREKAVIYHWFLLVSGMAAAVLFTVTHYDSLYQWLFLVSFPLFLRNGIAVSRATDSQTLDPYLKQLAISTLIFVITFGIGLLLAK